MIKTYYLCDKCKFLISEKEKDCKILSLYSHSEPSGAGDSDSCYEDALLCQKCLVDFVHYIVKNRTYIDIDIDTWKTKNLFAIRLKNFLGK